MLNTSTRSGIGEKGGKKEKICLYLDKLKETLTKIERGKEEMIHGGGLRGL